jgi:hypothetical protein
LLLKFIIRGKGDAMWKCQKCRETQEDSFEVCWNCGTSKEGVEDPTFATADEGEQPSELDVPSITADQPKHSPRRRAPARRIEQLIFVGFNGYAVALDRDTGEIVWSNNEMHRGYVTLLLDGDRLIASTNGYMYCLDPFTGQTLWHNPMTGYGYGPTALVSVRGQSTQAVIAQAAAQDAANAAAASSTSVSASS